MLVFDIIRRKIVNLIGVTTELCEVRDEQHYYNIKHEKLICESYNCKKTRPAEKNDLAYGNCVVFQYNSTCFIFVVRRKNTMCYYHLAGNNPIVDTIIIKEQKEDYDLYVDFLKWAFENNMLYIPDWDSVIEKEENSDTQIELF